METTKLKDFAQYARRYLIEQVSAKLKLEKLKKIIEELEDYEREVIYPLAAKKLDIDLDDGVKVNYAKFGMALKKIPGLDVAEE